MKAGYACAICCDGGGRSARARRKSENEEYNFKLHGLQALPTETVEACAEWLQRHIRENWASPTGRI